MTPDVTFTPSPTKNLFPTKQIQEEGYIFVYLSYDNDSPNWVYFDDLKVTHTKTNIIQYNEYYPFGLQTENSWTRENSSNNFLYNGGSELNANSGWYETFFRGYDAALGRFSQVDPLAGALASYSPYNYGLNNPVYFNDPAGDYVQPTKPPEHVGPTFADLFGSGGGPAGFAEIVGQTFGGDVIPGYMGSTAGYMGTTYIEMGGYTIEIDWSEIEGDGVGIDFSEQDNPAFSMIEVGQGDGGYWIDYGYGLGDGDVHVEGYKSTYVQAQQTGPDCPRCIAADLLRNMPFFGGNTPNPFHNAEAIYVDGGWSFVGAEGDAGGFFILVGKDKGKFFPFKEFAGGGATDAGLGVELGRIDIDGNPYDFNSNYLFGARDKVWLSAGEGISAGGAFSWSSFNGINVYGSSIQVGIGLSPWFVSGGYNHGEIEPKR